MAIGRRAFGWSVAALLAATGTAIAGQLSVNPILLQALNDVDVLRNHVAEWFATPGMDAGKIGAFYADTAKTAVDVASLKLSLKERAIRLDRSVAGTIRRLRRNVLRRGAYRVRDLLQSRNHDTAGAHQ